MVTPYNAGSAPENDRTIEDCRPPPYPHYELITEPQDWTVLNQARRQLEDIAREKNEHRAAHPMNSYTIMVESSPKNQERYKLAFSEGCRVLAKHYDPMHAAELMAEEVRLIDLFFIPHEVIYQWLDNTVETVITKLHDNIQSFQDTPRPGTSAPSIEAQTKKFQFLEKILADRAPCGDPKKDMLHRMIRGFLIEFIRQSEEEITPCNTENGKDGAAKAYWQTRSESEFHDAKISGIIQSAAGYNGLRNSHAIAGEHSASFHAVGEIIRTTIDTFKAEYPKIDPYHEPNPSVYNDHYVALQLASTMKDIRRRK